MGRRLRTIVAAIFATATFGGTVARASGAGELSPWYIDQFGGPTADLDALYAGRLGIVMMRTPRPQLYIAWRILHGERVGAVAGAALSIPCCDAPQAAYVDGAPPSGVDAWLAARKTVPKAPDLPNGIATERPGPNYTSTPNCFPEAFDVAAATLKARIAAHGAADPAVYVWLTRQDAVFQACHDDGVALPAAGQGGPDWLQADKAYQAAALALYEGRNLDAASRFAAIAKDAKSPWRGSGLYLEARALTREARAHTDPTIFAKTSTVLAALASAPPTVFGQSQAVGLQRSVEFRAEPDRLMTTLLAELSRPDPPADVAVSFRDVSDLADKSADKPEVMDWIATLKSAATVDPEADAAAQIRADSAARLAGLHHALDRWSAGKDVAWLVAALELANTGELPPAVLDAARTTPDASPAAISLHHDLLRLDIAAGRDPAAARRELDAVLARSDLSISDRNVFTAQRLQLATDPRDFARLVPRTRLCAQNADSKTGCVRDAWYSDTYQPSGVFDGPGSKGARGFGEDARATIDRLPLRERMALGADTTLPAELRLDVALTNFGRAVQLRDDAAAAALCGQLMLLLPQMKSDWAGIVAAKPGADKRFALFLALAKIPGVRTDLVDYTRPEGRIADFQQYWTDWIVPTKGDPTVRFRPLALYQAAGYGATELTPDEQTDLVCLGECGRSATPTRLPAFAAGVQARALAERGFFFRADHAYDKPPPPAPPGAIVAWDDMLIYAAAHPNDPRVPEALYWLVHVGRFGGSHDHSGRRAFKLLHARYPTSVWANKTPYFYD
jgi:hypothetical protein